jgi:magnesium-transporting ATPase (P-type)
MSEKITSPRPPVKRAPLWSFMIIAIPLAMIISIANLALTVNTIPHSDGSPFENGRAFGALTGKATIPTLFIWILFHFIFFRTRASLGKSLLMLLIMLAASVSAILILIYR